MKTMSHLAITVCFGVWTFVFSGLVQAQTLICQQNSHDVRLELYTDDQSVRLYVGSPMGYDYLPQIEGPITSAGVKQAQYQAQQLKSLGDLFWAQWKKEDCQIHLESPLKDTKLQCSKKAEKSSAGPIEFLGFSISTLTDDSFAGTWKSLRFRLSVTAPGEFGSDSFFIMIPVYEQGCVTLKTVDKQKKNSPQ